MKLVENLVSETLRKEAVVMKGGGGEREDWK